MQDSGYGNRPGYANDAQVRDRLGFNENSVFNLRQIDVSAVQEMLVGLLVEGEEIEMAFKTVRDQLVFTDRRIIAMDVQGVTGRRKAFTSMPYSRVQYFTVQTPALIELVPDCELSLVFLDGARATFEFRDKVDIGGIGRTISAHIL